VQYLGTPSYGALSDILELGTVILNFANALDAIEPVPESCRSAHNGLVSSALAVYDTLRVVEFVSTEQQFYSWMALFERNWDAFDVAFSRWLDVTGIQLPSLGGLR
jgi:hypothetical protein